jgi:hypothetical protein
MGGKLPDTKQRELRTAERACSIDDCLPDVESLKKLWEMKV